MGFEPTVKTQTFGGSDRSWFRPGKGTKTMLSGMLDMSAFSSNHVVNGKIPSGIALGKITATGFYGPYAGETPEHASIAVDATGGTFTITFRSGTTAAIAFNATAAQVKAALELLTEIDVDDFIVTGGPGAAGGATPYVISANPNGQYSHGDISNFTDATGSLTGGAGTAVITTTAGSDGASDGREVFVGHLWEDAPVGHVPEQTPDLTTAADQGIALFWEGVVFEAKLPTFGGTNGGVIDADGKTKNPQIRYI